MLLCDTTFVQLDTNRLKKVVQRGRVKHSLKELELQSKCGLFYVEHETNGKTNRIPPNNDHPSKNCPLLPPAAH